MSSCTRRALLPGSPICQKLQTPNAIAASKVIRHPLPRRDDFIPFLSFSFLTSNPKGESPAPKGRVVLDPLDVPRFAAHQDGGSPFGMLPTRSVGNIEEAEARYPVASRVWFA